MAFPILIIFYICFFYWLFKIKNRFLNYSNNIEEEEEKEGFNPYFKNLQEEDLRQIIEDEDYNRNHFHYKTIDDKTFD